MASIWGVIDLETIDRSAVNRKCGYGGVTITPWQAKVGSALHAHASGVELRCNLSILCGWRVISRAADGDQ